MTMNLVSSTGHYDKHNVYRIEEDTNIEDVTKELRRRGLYFKGDKMIPFYESVVENVYHLDGKVYVQIFSPTLD